MCFCLSFESGWNILSNSPKYNHMADVFLVVSMLTFFTWIVSVFITVDVKVDVEGDVNIDVKLNAEELDAEEGIKVNVTVEAELGVKIGGWWRLPGEEEWEVLEEAKCWWNDMVIARMGVAQWRGILVGPSAGRLCECESISDRVVGIGTLLQCCELQVCSCSGTVPL